ncbi:beta-galactosidase [Opitutaceae bacterium TAV5]|nr:beta-galactosidase [Opitutaceae bacterium TAV5]
MPSVFFPIGATYAPLPKATEVDISEWPDDIRRFASLGLNTLRLFICWDRVEKSRGQRDYSRVDCVFELAARHNLRVIVNVGGTFTNLQAIYAPRWLVYDEHCTLLKPAPDSPDELRFNRFKLCYDSPRYQALAREFIQSSVARYKDHPSLLAWSGWNEPRLSECYCKDTLHEYRLWLEKRYRNLADLAAAWSTEFPVYFRSWDDVFPQPQASFETGGYIPWLDWQRFTADNRKNKFTLIRNWIREIDPATPVLSHMCGPCDSDIFGDEDILGTSIYTIHAQAKRTEDFPPYDFTTRQHVPQVAMGLRPHRKDPEGFWVIETEAGPVSWVHDMAPRTYSPRVMNARDMLFVAHGARALLRWLYRSRVSDAQAGEFNMVGWDGRITDRAREFGELAAFLNRHAGLFLSHAEQKSGVAILCSGDCHPHAIAEGYQWRYVEATNNLNNALRHIGIQARICNVRQVLEGELAEARVLFIPFRPYVDPAMTEVLRQFVKNGGTLVVESPFATKNTNGIHYVNTPGHLIDLFGARVWDLEKLYEPCCGELPAFDFKARIEVCGATVEQRFSDGEPAVVSHGFGKGRAVLYGSPVFLPYQLVPVPGSSVNPVITFGEGEKLRAELLRQLEQAGIAPAWQLRDATPRVRQNLHVYFRKLPDGRRLVFVLNMDDEPASFGLKFPGQETVSLLGKSAADESMDRAADALGFRLREWGWAVGILQ